MRSHPIAVLVLAFAFLGSQSARAESSDPQSITLHLYGAFTPNSSSYGNNVHREMWAYGGAIQWGLAQHWAVSIDASRFSADRHSISPFVGGLTYRPAFSAKVRPWLEGGVGSYRLVDPALFFRYGLGSSGNLRDQFSMPPPAIDSRSEPGGFVGAGADAMFSRSLGLDLGVRLHNWRDQHISTIGPPHEVTRWGSMAALRTGLFYRF